MNTSAKGHVISEEAKQIVIYPEQVNTIVAIMDIMIPATI